MDKLIFIDLETTGLDTGLCDIIELGAVIQHEDSSIETISELYSIYGQLSHEVSGLTGIDQSDIINKTKFIQSQEMELLLRLAKDDYIAVCHNTDFDLAVLSRFGVKFNRAICTYKLSWLLFRNELQNFKLGTIRSRLKIPAGSGDSHRASYDAFICSEIFYKMQSLYDLNPIEKMINASQEASIKYSNIWPLGKYKGEEIDKKKHAEYIKWIITQPWLDLELRKKLANLE